MILTLKHLKVLGEKKSTQSETETKQWVTCAHKKQKRNFVLGKPWSDKQTDSVFFKMFLLLPAAPVSTSLTENKHKYLSVSHTVSIDETKEKR